MGISKNNQLRLIKNDLDLKVIPDYGLLFTSSSPFELKKIGKILLYSLPKTVLLAIQNLDNLLAFIEHEDLLFSKIIHAKNTTDKESISFDAYPLKLSDSPYSVSVFYIKKHGFYCQLIPFNLDVENSHDLSANTQLKKLSAKEAEVFRHYAQGKKRSQIANEMAISVHTYDNHLQAIRMKLTQSERQELLLALQPIQKVIG